MNAKVTDLSRERAARHPERMTFAAPLDALTYARDQINAERERIGDALLVPASDADEALRVAKGVVNACIEAHVRAARERQKEQQQ